MSAISFAKPRGTMGFSLIEVTLAVAIVAVGVISVLGLLPAGAQATREVADETLIGQAAADMLNDRRLTPYASATVAPAGLPAHTIPALTGDSETDLYCEANGFPTNAFAYSKFNIKVSRHPDLNSPDLARVTITANWPLIPKSAPPYTLASNFFTRVYFTEIARQTP